MNNIIHSALTFVVSQLIVISIMLYGYTVYQSTEKFWHFLIISAGGIIIALLFIEAMNRFIKVTHD